ncbi:MAG: hypothetical protein H7210_13550 [Pyrinomonadaceae bacterium]|nr:hypothetical protein [Phycisphaerales bacterium]
MFRDPDSLVDFTTANTDLEAQEILSELASHGIHAKIFSISISTMRIYSSEAIRIMVRRADVQRAADALRIFQKQPAFDDWSGVDIGDMSTLRRSEIAVMGMVCPSCRYDLSGLDLKKTDRCPECGAGFAERSVTFVPRAVLQPREEMHRRSYRTLAALCGICVLLVLYFTWDTRLMDWFMTRGTAVFLDPLSQP